MPRGSAACCDCADAERPATYIVLATDHARCRLREGRTGKGELMNTETIAQYEAGRAAQEKFIDQAAQEFRKNGHAENDARYLAQELWRDPVKAQQPTPPAKRYWPCCKYWDRTVVCRYCGAKIYE